MDYKEKVIALLNSQELSKEQKEKLKHIFPEFIKSKDERIKEALIEHIKSNRDVPFYLFRWFSPNDIIKWLIKQGNQKDVLLKWSEEDNEILDKIVNSLMSAENVDGDDYNIMYNWLKSLKEKMQLQPKQCEHLENFDNGEGCGIDGLYHAIKILERTVGRVTGYQSDDGILEHKAAIKAVKESYKKQGGQEHFYDFNANDWYVSKVDGKIHKITYNPTNKFKPKFRVDDFIANDYCSGKVIEITNDGYLLDTGQGIPFSCEHNAHLWTIQDAKDGDVLVNGSNIFIFHFINDTRLMGYCHVNIDNGRFYDDIGKNECFCLIDGIVTPATKEQCDMLFQKMKEAGYEWDSEKKELKKIEPKKLNADEVIAWLVANILDYEYFVKRFKIDFGL